MRVRVAYAAIGCLAASIAATFHAPVAPGSVGSLARVEDGEFCGHATRDALADSLWYQASPTIKTSWGGLLVGESGRC
jgi:hypothetical protein